MRKTIETLSQNSFKSILSKPTEGLVALTLLCLIDWPDGSQRQCFVKIFSEDESIGVFNEVLGYLLTKAENLPVASKAGLLILPEAIKSQLNQPVASIAFVSSRVNGNSPSSFYNIGDMLKFNSLCGILDSWSKLHQTIAFDEWVANQDRNLGNVIIDSYSNVTLIDHSNMPVDLVWDCEMLDKELNPRNVLADFFRKNPTLPQKIEILKGSEAQSDSFNLVRDEISYWSEKLLTPEKSKALIGFLEHRANFSNDRLSKRLGVLAGVA